MEQFSFEKLEVYSESVKLVSKVYTITKLFPSDEKYGLTNQIRRAVVSISSNIAESCGRMSYKDKRRFIEISYGSLLETYCQLQIALTLEYITKDTYNEIRNQFYTLSRLLTALSKSYSSKIE